MAVGTREGSSPPRDGEGTATGPSARGGGRTRPGGRGVEFWWWAFMRLSGIILVFLVVGHVLIMHVFGGGIDRVNFQFVAVRWKNPVWRTWDWLILSLAIVHGINGLRVIILDYVRKPGVRIAVSWAFYITGIVLFALGSIVVFTFDPSKWHA